MKKIISKARVKHRKLPLYVVLLILVLMLGAGYSFYQIYRIDLAGGLSYEKMKKQEMEAVMQEMLAGYPMEQMIPAILEKDPQTIAFLVSIAKKESNWGKRSPKHNEMDCFNYWGYKGPNRVGSGGHSCFESPEEAVDIVAKRITYLVEEQQLDTPAKMIVWKCGSTCAGHSRFGVRKWISDVSLYFKKLTSNDEEGL